MMMESKKFYTNFHLKDSSEVGFRERLTSFTLLDSYCSTAPHTQ